MHPTQVENKNISLAKTFRTLDIIYADNTATIPTRIELIKAGTWPDDSNKGYLKITEADLREFKSNFDKGTGMAGGQGFGIPIDFSHKEWGKAAGWIKELEIIGKTLFANVQWSKSGEEALANGDYKCISPSFYPSCLGKWRDPEDHSITAQNVLVGAGLTNIPFFKDLKPIMASNTSGERGAEDKNVIYINASARKEEKHMQPTLEDVRAKDNDALTEEERKVLADNKADLTADELKKFGFEVKADIKPQPKADPVKASQVKGDEGNVVMAATEVKSMNDRIGTLEEAVKASHKKEVEQEVTKHIARGAIKADQKDFWVEKDYSRQQHERGAYYVTRQRDIGKRPRF
jgi:phage I-like protein